MNSMHFLIIYKAFILNIFIDTISIPCTLILFNDKRKIIDKESFQIKWNESSILIPKIDEFLKKNTINYIDLENIVVVNWPWSFTWVRTTILAINTINYIIKKNITTLSYFNLFRNYPIIKSSSKRDCFFKKDEHSKIEIISNEELKKYLNNKNVNKIYWEANNDFFYDIKILDKIEYEDIIKKIAFKKLFKAEPLYIKKPNIS